MKKSIKNLLIKLITFYRLIGFQKLEFLTTIRGLKFYYSDYKKLKKQKGSDFNFVFGNDRPILNERFSESGTMSGHYFHQDLFVARKIFINNPKRHLDIGSRTDGFVAHVAVFRKIEIMDIRDQKSSVENIIFSQGDLMQLPDKLLNSFDSISSLHAIEHFGLGRYGDPIDYNGHLKALSNINKILCNGGTFYFSVPIGPQRIEFNAHRVFAVSYLLRLFDENYFLKSFSYVDDNGNLFPEVNLNEKNINENFGCNYGCGIFELIKR